MIAEGFHCPHFKEERTGSEGGGAFSGSHGKANVRLVRGQPLDGKASWLCLLYSCAKGMKTILCQLQGTGLRGTTLPLASSHLVTLFHCPFWKVLDTSCFILFSFLSFLSFLLFLTFLSFFLFLLRIQNRFIQLFYFRCMDVCMYVCV